MKFFYTYVLRSRKDGKLYIGWCKDLQKRLNDHSLEKVSSTKTRKPLQLVYFEGCLEEKLANDPPRCKHRGIIGNSIKPQSKLRGICFIETSRPAKFQRSGIKREKALKTGFGRAYLKRRLEL